MVCMISAATIHVYTTWNRAAGYIKMSFLVQRNSLSQSGTFVGSVALNTRVGLCVYGQPLSKSKIQLRIKSAVAISLPDKTSSIRRNRTWPVCKLLCSPLLEAECSRSNFPFNRTLSFCGFGAHWSNGPQFTVEVYFNPKDRWTGKEDSECTNISQSFARL